MMIMEMSIFYVFKEDIYTLINGTLSYPFSFIESIDFYWVDVILTELVLMAICLKSAGCLREGVHMVVRDSIEEKKKNCVNV